MNRWLPLCIVAALIALLGCMSSRGLPIVRNLQQTIVVADTPLKVVSITSPIQMGDYLTINVHTEPHRNVGAVINVYGVAALTDKGIDPLKAAEIMAMWQSSDNTTDSRGNATITLPTTLPTEGLVHIGNNTLIVSVFVPAHGGVKGVSRGTPIKILGQVETFFVVQ